MQNKKILIVDDESDMVELLQQRLEMEQFEVSTAFDGLDGLEKAKELLPNLIIMDVMMPRMNGYEVLAELKRNEGLKNIPVIFLSARSQATDQNEAKKLGASGYIIKPFDTTELLLKIRDYLPQ